MKINSLRNVQSAFILFVLVFNSTFSVLASSYNTNKAQYYADSDAVLICSGTSFRWMSKSAFMEKGLVVYIDAPENTPNEYHQVKCSYAFLADLHTDDISIAANPQKSDIVYHALQLSIAQRPYTAFPYLKALSRAPPVSS